MSLLNIDMKTKSCSACHKDQLTQSQSQTHTHRHTELPHRQNFITGQILYSTVRGEKKL